VNVFIVGVTGFLGYHATKEFVARGHHVSGVALPPLPADGVMPSEVEIRLANLEELHDAEVEALLKGKDAVVFAAGADDRVVPKAPAYEFFRRHNVQASARFFRLARQAGVKRGVVLGSYFAYFDRIWPEMKLAEHHPYIRSRREQEEQCLQASMPDLQLCLLELPYIFGTMPGKVPLWEPLVNMVRNYRVVPYPRGGTNMIAVQHIGEAIVGAIERGQGGERYVIGDENLTWVQFLHLLSRFATGKAKPVITIPTLLYRMQMKQVLAKHTAEGYEGGLNPVEFTNLMTARTFFDPTPSRQALGYGQGGLEDALRATVAACPPGGRTTFW